MSGMRAWLEDAAAERTARGRVRRDDVRRNPETQGGLLDLASNDYLGLAGDERLREAAIDATGRFGTGARASRVVTGTTAAHAELEHELGAVDRAAGVPGVLQRLHRQPRRGDRARQPRHAAHHRRPHPRLADRRRPAVEIAGSGLPAPRSGRARAAAPRSRAAARGGGRRVDLLGPRRRHRPGRAPRRCAPSTTRCWWWTRRTGSGSPAAAAVPSTPLAWQGPSMWCSPPRCPRRSAPRAGPCSARSSCASTW